MENAGKDIMKAVELVPDEGSIKKTVLSMDDDTMYTLTDKIITIYGEL